MSAIVDSDALSRMSAEEIAQAVRDGRLDGLLAGLDIRRADSLSEEQLREVVSAMSDEDFAAAKAGGLLKLGKGVSKARLEALSSEQIVERFNSGALDSMLRGEA